jgi:RNA polymerase sigma-70 factor (ECF subfamily)
MDTKKFIQISERWCLFIETVSQNQRSYWCEAIYDAKAAELILYGRALGLSHCEAEDVLQETFLTLMEKPAPPSRPEHYCVRSYRNQAFNYRRSLWRRLTRELEARRWFEKSPSESAAEQAAMRCLAELPVEQREVIVLKFWHQYTFEEIGELLETSPNTIAGRYRYGLQKIKSRLDGVIYEKDEPSDTPVACLEATPTWGGA